MSVDSAFIDKGHHGEGVRRVRTVVYAAAGAWLSRTAALGQKSANLAQASIIGKNSFRCLS